MNSEEAPVYTIRLTLRARRDIEFSRDRLAALTDEDIADLWEAGLERAISHLATSPIRPLIAEQEHFRFTIRQLLYRRPETGRNAPAHRILYTVQMEGVDGPMVTILSVRHAAMAPITAKEAKEVEEAE